MDEWHTTDACKSWLLPLSLPQRAPDDIKAKDKFKLPMSWVESKLIPLCEEHNCKHP